MLATTPARPPNDVSALGSRFAGACVALVVGALLALPSGAAAETPLGYVVGWGYNSQGMTTPPAGLGAVIAVEGGTVHTIALRADGTVVAWGYNSSGQATVPAGLTGVRAIAAGSHHNLALRSDGTVVGWGSNSWGALNIPAGLSGVTALAGGTAHSLALKSDGTVVGWGAVGGYVYGQVNPPAGLNNVTRIAAGSVHSLALRADGSVVAWGENSYGQSNVPTDLAPVAAIAGGSRHTVVLLADGTVRAWGDNAHGQCDVPSSLSDVVAIAAGNMHSVALRRDGTAVVWGSNYYGQLAVPGSATNLFAVSSRSDFVVALVRIVTPNVTTHPASLTVTPTAAASFTVAASGTPPFTYQWLKDDQPIAGATSATLALSQVSLSDAGSYRAVVSNPAGSVTSDPATLTVNRLAQTITFPSPGALRVDAAPVTLQATASSDLPVSYTSANPSIASVADGVLTVHNAGYVVITATQAGDEVHLAAPSVRQILRVTGMPGTVVAWGANNAGQTTVPAALSGVVSISSCYAHTLALKQDGTVAAWGLNSNGQTVVPAGLTDAVAIAAGGYHSLALRSNGIIVGWGHNGYYQLSPPPTLNNVIAIAAGLYHSVALKSDGTVVAWGQNSSGQTAVPAGLSGVIAIAAGQYHSLALKSDGTVVAWGLNNYGQCTVPGNVTRAIAIAAGGFHSVALVSDGATTASWGASNYGQLSSGPSWARLIAAGEGHTLAVQPSGTVVGWGLNNSGQTSPPGGVINVSALAAGSMHSVALVSPLPPVITTQPADATADATASVTFSVTATGTPPLSYQWTKDGAELAGANAATLTIASVHALHAGEYRVTITNAAGSVTSRAAILTVNRLPQTIVFEEFAPKRIDDEPFTLQAAASSGLPVVFTSSDPAIATTELATVTLRGIGETILTASQPGDEFYLPAEPVSRTLVVAPAPPGILAAPTDLVADALTDVVFAVTANGTPPLRYQWYFEEQPIAGATDATLTLAAVRTTAMGTYHVVVTNDVGHVICSPVTLWVHRLQQTLTFGELPAVTTHAAPFTLAASASSGLSVAFSSDNPAVATVDGTTVTITGAGTATITASQFGDTAYLPADSVSRTLTVTSGNTGPLMLVADDFNLSAGAAPDAALWEWSGEIGHTGAGALNLLTQSVQHSWLRSKSGATVAADQTLRLQFRGYAYAENWNPGVYGNKQPRGLRAGNDTANVAEFYSASRTSLGLRVRRAGVESALTVAFPAGVDSMHDYEIAVTATSVTFSVDGVELGAFSTNLPDGELHVYFSTDDGGGVGNVPLSFESVTLQLSGPSAPATYTAWQTQQFSSAELADPLLSGPQAVLTADGLPNLLKYALGLDAHRTVQPGAVAASATSADWTFVYRRPATVTDLTYGVEATADFVDWTTISVVQAQVSEQDGWQTWEARCPKLDQPRLFFRLKVSRP